MKLSQKPHWYSGLGSMLFTILIALTIRWGGAEAFVIPSGSMLPSLQIHDHIFVNKLAYGIRAPFTKTWLVQFDHPKRGEVIVFKDPRDNQTFLVKRVVGLPGDKIYYHDNQLFINDRQVKTELAKDSLDFDLVRDKEVENHKSAHEHFSEKLGDHTHSVLHVKNYVDMEIGPLQVPEHSLFMMGDHRDNSADSRVWGFAPEENILGRASFVWLSCEEGIPGIEMGCDPTSIRWSRFFHEI